MELEKELSEIQTLGKREEKLKEESSKKYQELRKRILEGETTGDPIRDFVLIYARDSPEVADNFRIFQSQVNENINNLVLRIEKHQESMIHYMFPHSRQDNFMTNIYNFKLGQIKQELRVNIKDGTFTIPTEKHLTSNNPINGEYWEIQDGDILLDSMDLLKIGLIPSLYPSGFVNREKINFHFGDEVKKYFKTHASPGELEYANGLALLGLTLPAELDKKYQEKVQKDKLGVIHTLEGLFDQEAKLRTKIQGVFASVEICPDAIVDEVAAKLWTYEDRGQLERTVGSIEETLKKALKKGLHKEEEIIELDHRGIKIPTSFSSYIQTACQKYKVEISA
ncbi:MAG: hypothetical protein WC584_00440 [Candidatus Pacearchaeota archaeon]